MRQVIECRKSFLIPNERIPYLCPEARLLIALLGNPAPGRYTSVRDKSEKFRQNLDNHDGCGNCYHASRCNTLSWDKPLHPYHKHLCDEWEHESSPTCLSCDRSFRGCVCEGPSLPPTLVVLAGRVREILEETGTTGRGSFEAVAAYLPDTPLETLESAFVVAGLSEYLWTSQEGGESC